MDMPSGRPQFFAERSAYSNNIAIYFRVDARDGNAIHVPTNITFETLTENEFFNRVNPRPFLELRAEAAQQLMDELWRAGLRPAGGEGSAGQLGATERHLADMRALVFKTDAKA
jgi:hypothetical protein